MGAWGYGYKDNDTYYNEAATYVEPLITALAESAEDSTRDDYRIRLLWTVNLLKNAEEEIRLPDWCVGMLRTSVEILRGRLTEESENWRDPDEYLTVVGAELQGVEDWLNTLREPAFLEDRAAALFQAIERGKDL